MSGKKISINHETILKEITEYVCKQAAIYEGLIYSYDLNSVLKGLKKMGFNRGDIRIEQSFSGRTLLVKLQLETTSKSKLSQINQHVENLCGWHLSAILNENGKVLKKGIDFTDISGEFVWLQYEPKFSVEISKYEIPSALYHIAPEKVFEKIKKIGLTPKSKSSMFSYPDRIYLCKNIDELLKLSKMFVATNDKATSNKMGVFEDSFIILEVSLNNLILPIRLFGDPNFKSGYYTLENIPPQIIKPIIRIETNNKGKIIKKENI